MKKKWNPIGGNGAVIFLRTLSRLIVGAVLTVSGFFKLMAPPEEFALALEAYHFLPSSALLPLARSLPWGEFFTGVALCLGFFMEVAVPAAITMFAAFASILGSILVRGLPLEDCGCFGRMGLSLSPWQTLLLDLLLLGLSLWVFRDRERRFSVDRWLS